MGTPRIVRWLGLTGYIEPLFARLHKLEHAILHPRSQLREDVAEIKSELHSLIWLLSNNGEIKEKKMIRYVPMRIYFGDPMADPQIRQQLIFAMMKVAGAFGFLLAYELPEEEGSWYKEWWMRTKKFWSKKEVQARLEKLEEAAQVVAIEKPRAEVGQIEASSIAAVIAAVKEQRRCVVQFGNFLAVKIDDDLAIRKLTDEQIRLLEEDREIVKTTERLLELLSGSSGETTRPAGNRELEAPSDTKK